MKKIKEYIKNIDFDLVDDDAVLDNVYGEIKGSEEKLMTDIETSHNMEQLIKKSNSSQILKMLKTLQTVQIIKKRIGSRVFETIFTTLSHNKKSNKEETKEILLEETKEILLDPIFEKFNEIITNRNGTYVMRKCFDFIYETPKKGKSKVCFEGYDTKGLILDILDRDLEKDTIITIVHFLKIDFSKRIARKIVEKYLTLENIKSPHFSFIFEDLIEIADQKTLQTMSSFIETHFVELFNDKCANYVVTKLIKRTPDRSEMFYSLLDLSTLNINSNIVLRILENFSKEGKTEKVKEILNNFYGITEDESVFHKLLLSASDGLDTKFIDTVRFLMDLDGDVLNVNSDLVEYYDGSWLNKRAGIKLVKSFLEGGAPNKIKKRLIAKLNISTNLLKKADGVKISNLVKTLKRTKG